MREKAATKDRRGGGATNRRADRDLCDELRRFGRGEAYDEQPLPELDSEAIDFRVASELFAPVRTLKPSDLDTLRLLTRHQGRKVPTVGGVLLFGRERERHFPDAWVQAGRFRGTNRSRIADRTEIHGPLVSVVDAAVAFVQKHNLLAAEMGAVRRVDRWTLPPIAVREAVVNALVHADYSQRGAPIRVALFDDRLEIENPGLLPFGLTVDELPHGISKLRNRVIGRVFHELRLIEQWGSGIQRMIAACRDAGLADPVFERDFIYVTTQNLSPDQLQQLSDEVGPDRSLLVLCSAFRGKADRFANLTVKKIPKQVLARCEWGHDDYSLKVENLPQPPKKPKAFLFDELEDKS